MILNCFSDSEAIVEQTLDMLKTFVGSPGTYKFLLKLETTQDLLENHFTKYVFLNNEVMFDHLSSFYKTMTMFWEVNDTPDDFHKYMKPISEFLGNLLSLDASGFVQRKRDILRICYILNGVAQGFSSAESYNQFFDWFYPDHFRIIAEIFKHFSDDLMVLKGLFKLMRELLDNKTHRLKADSCYLSGFLLFKEISSILLEYFKYVNMYQTKKIKNDKYEEKYQFIEMAVDIFGNIVAGNFINFSICEYYNDTWFIDLSILIFTLITVQDHKEYTSFTKLTYATYKMIESFMKFHTPLMMNHFDPSLVVKTLEATLLGLMTENENKGSCCNALKDFCTTLYTSRVKLGDKITDLLNLEGSIFKEILKTLLTTVIYEEHKVIWVFQKPLFPTIVINGKEDYEVVKNGILENEPNTELRQKILEELDALWENIELSLDKYNREKFSSNFSRFKNSLVKFK